MSMIGPVQSRYHEAYAGVTFGLVCCRCMVKHYSSKNDHKCTILRVLFQKNFRG